MKEGAMPAAWIRQSLGTWTFTMDRTRNTRTFAPMIKVVVVPFAVCKVNP